MWSSLQPCVIQPATLTRFAANFDGYDVDVACRAEAGLTLTLTLALALTLPLTLTLTLAPTLTLYARSARRPRGRQGCTC